MAGFMVTQNFTWNSNPVSAIYYVNNAFAASAVAAINLAVAVVQAQINAKAAALAATVAFGTSSAQVTAQ